MGGQQPHISARQVPKTCVNVVPGEPQIIIGRDLDPSQPLQNDSKKSFTFDHVFGRESVQTEIFNELAAPLLEQFFAGFNATILAYGQTFSGKTYTMGSCNDHNTRDEERGIIPRVVLDIFERIENDRQNSYRLHVSFLEIYQEQIRDLLMRRSDLKEISIRESKNGLISISGIHEELVVSPSDMLRCLERGGLERTTGDTQMHSHSSRSHAIFTITLEQIQQTPSYDNYIVLKRSKLHLVDLAGSERLKRTGAEGIRLRESVKINSGLLALGNVISVLGSDRLKTVEDRHVPYRDSKLTRLLQDSLGGNSRTVMIACISPLEEDIDETLNTLKYAYRARKIHNKPIVNTVDHQAVEMNNLQLKINQLEGELQTRTDEVSASPTKPDFDNEQWVQYFMEELKARTIRGTNATKALEVANAEKAAMEDLLNKSRATISELKYKEMELASDLEISKDLHAKANSMVSEVESDARALAHVMFDMLNGRSPVATEEEKIRKILENYIDKNILSSAEASNDKNNVIEVEDASVALKPLEIELLEARKRISELEETIQTSDQTENIKSEFEIAKQTVHELLSVNELLKQKNLEMHNEMNAIRQQTAESELKKEDNSSIMSIKVLNETGCQTESLISGQEFAKVVSDESEYPVHTNRAFSPYAADGVAAEGQETLPSPQKLVQELNAVMKAKVDLLRELSKVNKEAERARHTHFDSMQRLERELDASQRSLIKMQDEHIDKESAREKMKEEYERKLKLQETQLQRLKTKAKDLEKNVRDKELAEKRLLESHQDIEKLHSQISAMKKKAKEESEKFNEMDQRRVKEVSLLKRAVEEDEKRIRHLEAQVEMSRKKLDRKNEELMALTKKMKDSGFGAPSSVAGSVKSFRLSKVQEHDKPDEMSAQASVVDHANDILSDVDRGEALDEKMKPAIETLDTLQKSLRARSADIEKFQLYHRISKRLREVRLKVEELERKIHEAEQQSPSGENGTTEQSIDDMRNDRATLLRQIVELRSEKRKAEENMNEKAKSSGLDDSDDFNYAEFIDKFSEDAEIVKMITRLVSLFKFLFYERAC